MSFKNFILSKVFIKNLGFAIVIAVGVVMMLLIYLNFYTRHGQARPVPDFLGLTMEQTVKLAKKSRLRYQVIDSVYTTLVPRGCVAEQNPKPGFKVKKWRNIVLTINAFYPEMVAMPNLVDLPKKQAISLIESSGLEIGLKIYRPDLSTDVVIDQLYNGKNIPEGSSLQKGSVVDLILGGGYSNQHTSAPDLMGMNLESAKNKILESSLNLGTYIYDNTIINGEDTMKAIVYKQRPEYKDYDSVQLGSVIYIWLTVDSTKLRTDSTLMISDTIPSVDLLNKTPD
jgi:beta-lactam-binding protein with PASTA domain